MQRWQMEPEEEPLVRAQLPAGPPIGHDLTPINEPEEEAVHPSNGAAHGAALLAPPLQSGASSGEGYFAELAERIADEDA